MQASLLQRKQSGTDDFWSCKLQLYPVFCFTVCYPCATALFLNTLGIYLFFFFFHQKITEAQSPKIPFKSMTGTLTYTHLRHKKGVVQLFQIRSHSLYCNTVQSFHLRNVLTSWPISGILICSHKVTCCSILKKHLTFTTHFCPLIHINTKNIWAATDTQLKQSITIFFLKCSSSPSSWFRIYKDNSFFYLTHLGIMFLA